MVRAGSRVPQPSPPRTNGGASRQQIRGSGPEACESDRTRKRALPTFLRTDRAAHRQIPRPWEEGRGDHGDQGASRSCHRRPTSAAPAHPTTGERMRISTRRRSTLSTAFALLVILSMAAPAWAADPPTLAPSGAQPTLDGRVTGSKSATSRLAETDAKLLARKDSAMVNVVIKLDVDSVAVYEGGIADLARHQPAGDRQGPRQRLRRGQGLQQVRRVPPGRVLGRRPQGGPVREAGHPARYGLRRRGRPDPGIGR